MSSTDTNQASEDNIGCEYCSGEDDKPGWKGSYSSDGAIGYSVCINCNLDAKAAPSLSDGLLNKLDEDVKLEPMNNQASEDELQKWWWFCNGTGTDACSKCRNSMMCSWHSARLDDLQSIIRTEKLKLLNELDKSMPTAGQLTTKYGYHMPEKQYGYKLALHDIREVLAKLEAEL